jgi:transcriptional regulator with XRE-family HTH domain
MYEKFFKTRAAQFHKFPSTPDLELGLAIKHVRLRMGITQQDLSTHSGMKLASLRTLENGYARATTLENLNRLSRVLRVGLDEILLEGREWFPANFFVLRRQVYAPPKRASKRRAEETWYEQKPIRGKGFELEFLSPPITSKAHFVFARMTIDPQTSVDRLRLPYPSQIVGFVERGSLDLSYDREKPVHVFGNQGFQIRGDKLHQFHNADETNLLTLSLAFSLTPSHQLQLIKTPAENISVGRAVKLLRSKFSDAKERPLSFRELSFLTGLDEKSLQYLESTEKPDEVVYWDKVERITEAFGISLQEFLNLAHNSDVGSLALATAHDQAVIDYRHYFGVRMKSAVSPSATHAFQICDMEIESRRGPKRGIWKRTDASRIALHVEHGNLRVEVGKNRKTSITAGESVYFDASLGYILTNTSSSTTRLRLATFPPTIY